MKKQESKEANRVPEAEKAFEPVVFEEVSEPEPDSAETETVPGRNTPDNEASETIEVVETLENAENDITFDIKFRGYDRHQVDDYIEKLTIDYNNICRNCSKLEKDNRVLLMAVTRLVELEDDAYENAYENS